MQRFNFDRWRGNTLLAEGIAVHAEDKAAATTKARELMGDGCTLISFRDNTPCPKGAHCKICHKSEAP